MHSQRTWLPLALAFGCVAATQAHAANGVVGGGGYFRAARVCIDANGNGQCDAGEQTASTDAAGRYSLIGNGAIVAEIVPGTTTLYDPSNHVASAVSQALTLRAPASTTSQFVSPISTELQALTDDSADAAAAATELASRVGVTPAQLLEDPATEPNSAVAAALKNEAALAAERIADARGDDDWGHDRLQALRNRLVLDQIKNVVVIYAENRSFDNLFGFYPGANGLRTPHAKSIQQVDRDGKTVLATLPPAWGGLTAAGQTPAISQAQTTNVWPNAPFQIDTPFASHLYGYSPIQGSIITRDLYHRFFENIMQINGGKNDQYAAWADSGGLVMGYFDGSRTQLWDLARDFTLADNFFQAAYGGSFLNHQYLICACAPRVSASFVTNTKASINVLGTSIHGVPQLAANSSQAPSALTGPTSFKTGNIAPLDYFGAGDGYRAVNTMQPAYQPSGNPPADANGNDLELADPTRSNTLEPQTQTTIGDQLSAKGVSWVWYAGGWGAAVANPWNGFGASATSTTIYKASSFGTADPTNTDFQAHHQPFNYYANFDPVTHAANRAAHLKDRADLLSDISAGTLPAVTFYKPVGFQNQHPGYTNVTNADEEIVTLVNQLRNSKQWKHMLVVVTYDEFGGQFDHVAPPKGDLIGPGTRIPALIISPYAKRGFVDHTQYDTASILRFLTHRYSLKPLPGLTERDDALVERGYRPMGYFVDALRLRP